MRRRDLGLALLIAASGLALLVWLVPTAPLTGDGQHYVAFAQSHLQHGAASTYHARRVLAPLIVATLPFDALVGFHLVTLVSLFAASVLTWGAAVTLGVRPAVGLASIVFFLGTWAVAPNLREYTLVDPVAWAFVAGIWLATSHRRWAIAAMLAAFGVLAKEVVLVAAIAAAAAAWSPGHGWRGVIRASAIVAPAMLVLAALALILPGSGTDITAYVTKWWADGLGSLGLVRVVYLTFVSYGALWLLIPKGVGLLPTHLRRAAFVCFCAAPVLPSVGSPERMEELIFPAVIAAACVATRDCRSAVAFVLAVGNALFVARVGGDAQLPSVAAWLGLVSATFCVVWCYYRPTPRLAALARAATVRIGSRVYRSYP